MKSIISSNSQEPKSLIGVGFSFDLQTIGNSDVIDMAHHEKKESQSCKGLWLIFWGGVCVRALEYSSF